ncbi:CAP protein [Hibiscus syriacus]|uniref:CAP protein n=1 Tax=Hibiscus syriacus TaxID=106335 RepID=A0A6A2WGP5_HIBSY|nr:protein MIZU-KUSSEI 1-like [Hibiscus syriacus]KAE8655125.1 CAP protein [Hibiscus syriacus]
MEESKDTRVNTQPHLRNLLNQIMELLAPLRSLNGLIFSHCLPGAATLVTGTIICPINSRKIKLCLKENTKANPLVFIELPLASTEFTSSIDSGVLRIVLDPVPDSGITQRWLTYCNGQKVGFARRLKVGQEEKWVLEMMQMVSSGAGFLPQNSSTDAGGFKYLRGQFERIVGSDGSEAYHLVDPAYWLGQDLSVFFLSKY